MWKEIEAAPADAILGLYRERGKHNAVLSISGRELGERNLSIEWNPLTYSWKYLGDADRMELTRRRQEVLNAVQSLGRASLKEIAETVGQDKSNTNKRLQDLVGMGHLVRIVDEKERVLYELPPSKEKH